MPIIPDPASGIVGSDPLSLMYATSDGGPRGNRNGVFERLSGVGMLCHAGLVSRSRLAVLALIVMSSAAACESSPAQPSAATAAAGTSTSPASIDASAARMSDTDGTVPTDRRFVADRGCLDKPGRLRATVNSWYPRRSRGTLGHGGSRRRPGPRLDAFQRVAAQAVTRAAPRFKAATELQTGYPRPRCVTHRDAWFRSGGDDLQVAAWRMRSAASPFWLPNEALFESIDDSTLESQGDHIVVVVAVAPDGTTVAVTAYGRRAAERAAGWPTTQPTRPSSPESGPATLPADDLVPVARRVLAFVLAQR